MSAIIGISIWASLMVTPVILFFAAIKRSWKGCFAAAIILLPFSLYCLTGEPPVSYFGYLPILLFVLAFCMRLLERTRMNV